MLPLRSRTNALAWRKFGVVVHLSETAGIIGMTGEMLVTHNIRLSNEKQATAQVDSVQAAQTAQIQFRRVHQQAQAYQTHYQQQSIQVWLET